MRVLIVDDEPLAREVLRNLMADVEDVEVIEECRSGIEAVAAIRDLQPELVFLDIQMPGLDGFGVISEIGTGRMPPVVFVTAYDEFALRAFEVHAVDYLLKPFTDGRFWTALEHARQWLDTCRAGEFGARLSRLLADHQAQLNGEGAGAPAAHQLDRISIKSGGAVYFLDVEEIDWIEAANNSVKLHVGQRSHLMRGTIRSLEERLDPRRFARIHRSTIVQLDRIRRLKPQEHGDYLVELRDGTTLRMSRRRREELRARLPV